MFQRECRKDLGNRRKYREYLGYEFVIDAGQRNGGVFERKPLENAITCGAGEHEYEIEKAKLLYLNAQKRLTEAPDRSTATGDKQNGNRKAADARSDGSSDGDQDLSNVEREAMIAERELESMWESVVALKYTDAGITPVRVCPKGMDSFWWRSITHVASVSFNENGDAHVEGELQTVNRGLGTEFTDSPHATLAFGM